MQLYLAKIEGTFAPKNTQLQIRILPHMETLDRDVLPVWPYFFKHQFFTGNLNDLVWCISNPEFSMGYILGLANKTTLNGDFRSESIQESLFKAFSDSYFETQGQDYGINNLIISFFNEESIHFVKKTTGDTIIAFKNGTFYAVEQEAIRLKVGNSILMITEDKIALQSDTIRLGSDNVSLGNNPQGYVTVSPTTNASTAITSSSVRA